MRARHFPLWIALGILPCVTAARADDQATRDPTSLKADADAAFDTRNYAHALDAYRGALDAGGDAKLHYNIAQTLTALERYPEALESYQRFLAEAPPGTLNAAQQERFFLLLDELKSKITRLDVSCDVAGARVLVRDRAVGMTPLAGPLSLNAGAAKVEIIAEGYTPFAANLELVGGATKKLTAKLDRVDFSGSITIHGNIAARVGVDGTDRGETPLTLRLDRGTHALVVSAVGYVTQSKTIEVDPGSQHDLVFGLRRSPDYTLAATGFGVGFVGVALGAVMGILAFTSFGDAKAQCDTVNKECGPSAQAGMLKSRTYGIVSDVAFGVGVVGAGFGVFGLLTADKDRKSERLLQFVVLANGAGLRGSF